MREMLKFCLILLVFIAVVCIFIFCRQKRKPVSIRIAMYWGIPELKKLEQIISDAWKAAGNKEKLEFSLWDCYAHMPDESDIYCYDSLAFNALIESGLFGSMDGFNTDYAFSWATAMPVRTGKLYAAPFFICADFLIVKNECKNAYEGKTLMEIYESMAIPVKGMMASYYTKEAWTRGITKMPDCESWEHETDKEIMDIMYHITELSKERNFDLTGLDTFNGRKSFLAGEAKALYFSSETLYYLKANSEDVSIMLPQSGENSDAKFYIDYFSIGRHLSGKKKRKCLELIKMMTGEGILFAHSDNGGRPTYDIPANRNVLKRLAEKYPMYESLLNAVDNERNRPVFYDSSFYTERFALWERINNWAKECMRRQDETAV